LRCVDLVNRFRIIVILWNDVLFIYYVPIFWGGGNNKDIVDRFAAKELVDDPFKEMSFAAVGSGKYQGIARVLIKFNNSHIYSLIHK